MVKRSVKNKVKSTEVKGEEVKDLYCKITAMDLKEDKYENGVEIEYELDPGSQKAVMVREALVDKQLEKTPDINRQEAFSIIREKNFSNILNDMISSEANVEFCMDNDIDFAPNMSYKELMMLAQVKNALKGDLKSAQFIVDRIDGKAKSITENKSVSIKGSLEDMMKRADKNG